VRSVWTDRWGTVARRPHTGGSITGARREVRQTSRTGFRATRIAQRTACLPASAAAAIVLVLLAMSPVHADSDGGLAKWRGPFNVSRSARNSLHPCSASDPAGGVHAVWCESQNPGGPCDAIHYSLLTDNVWSPPVDIVYSPDGRIGPPRLVSDGRGVLHLVWGDGGIFHARADASSAATARGWTPPLHIAGPSGTWFRPARGPASTTSGLNRATPLGFFHRRYSQDPRLA